MQAKSHREPKSSHILTLMVKSALVNKDVEVPIKNSAQVKVKELVAMYPDRALRAIRVWMAEDY